MRKGFMKRQRKLLVGGDEEKAKVLLLKRVLVDLVIQEKLQKTLYTYSCSIRWTY